MVQFLRLCAMSNMRFDVLIMMKMLVVYSLTSGYLCFAGMCLHLKSKVNQNGDMSNLCKGGGAAGGNEEKRKEW